MPAVADPYPLLHPHRVPPMSSNVAWASVLTSEALEKNFGGGLERAARDHELDGPVQIGFRVGDLLGERQGVPGLDQHVQAPRFDLLALGLGVFESLGQGGGHFALF